MEHFRSVGQNHNYQWCDNELVMLLDKITGEPLKEPGTRTITTLEKAKDYAINRCGLEDRLVIIKLSCITAFKLTGE